MCFCCSARLLDCFRHREYVRDCTKLGDSFRCKDRDGPSYNMESVAQNNVNQLSGAFSDIIKNHFSIPGVSQHGLCISERSSMSTKNVGVIEKSWVVVSNPNMSLIVTTPKAAAERVASKGQAVHTDRFPCCNASSDATSTSLLINFAPVDRVLGIFDHLTKKYIDIRIPSCGGLLFAGNLPHYGKANVTYTRCMHAGFWHIDVLSGSLRIDDLQPFQDSVEDDDSWLKRHNDTSPCTEHSDNHPGPIMYYNKDLRP